MALGQHKVVIPSAADQLHLLDEGADLAAGYSSVGLKAIFGGTPGFQIDGCEIDADRRSRASPLPRWERSAERLRLPSRNPVRSWVRWSKDFSTLLSLSWSCLRSGQLR